MVTHSKSRSQRDPVTGGLVASDNTREIFNMSSMKQAAEEHSDWGFRQPSWFLSVFSDEQHARMWAKQRARTQNPGSIVEVYIHEIDTTSLPPDAYVCHAASLSAKLDIVNPYSTDELVFLHRIPVHSLRCTRCLAEIEVAGELLRLHVLVYNNDDKRACEVSTITHGEQHGL